MPPSADSALLNSSSHIQVGQIWLISQNFKFDCSYLRTPFHPKLCVLLLLRLIRMRISLKIFAPLVITTRFGKTIDCSPKTIHLGRLISDKLSYAFCISKYDQCINKSRNLKSELAICRSMFKPVKTAQKLECSSCRPLS